VVRIELLQRALAVELEPDMVAPAALFRAMEPRKNCGAETLVRAGLPGPAGRV
jgi:hypothetical protein